MRSRFCFALGLVGALALGACGDGDGQPTGARGKKTSVYLTDAPFPYDSVARVDVHVVSIALTTHPDTTSANTDWVTVAAPDRTYNLLDLQDGTASRLAETQLTTGRARAVKMIIDTDKSAVWYKWAVDANGQVRAGYPQAPISWQSSAGRATLYALVAEPLDVRVSDDPIDVVIDFDVGRSFLCTDPSCTAFVFSPTIRAVDLALTGTLSGRVTGDTNSANPRPIANTTITVYEGGGGAPSAGQFVAATGRTDENGNYTIHYLTEGQYTVRADAPRGSAFTPGERAPVQITAGHDTHADITLPTTTTGSTGLHILPGVADVSVGNSTVLHAFATASAGPLDSTAVQCAWSTDAPNVIGVEPGGALGLGPSAARVTGRAAGSAVLTCAFDGRVATATVNVHTTASVSSVIVSPLAVTIAAGTNQMLTATAYDVNNVPLTNYATYWSVSDTTKAWVTQYGLVHGIAQGTVTVTATIGGKSATSTVTIGAPPPAATITLSADEVTLSLTAVGRDTSVIVAELWDANGQRTTGQPITWTSSDPAVAEMQVFANGQYAMFRARRVGTTTVTATSNGKSAVARVKVQQ